MTATSPDQSGTPQPTVFLTPTTRPTAIIPTETAQPDGIIVAAVGDMACSTIKKKNCADMEVSDMILDWNPLAFFALGDTQYEHGEYIEFQNNYALSYGRLDDIVKPIIGNHEYRDPAGESDPWQLGYWNYFDPTKTGRFGAPWGYYSFDIGNWHVIALNSNCKHIGRCNTGSPQEKWLVDDLNRNPKICTIVLIHQAFFSSGGRASESLDDIWSDITEFHVDMVLSGHDHIYERFAPLDRDGNKDRAGTRQFVVGTGGKNLTDIEEVAPGSEVVNNQTYGALKLFLRRGSYSWSFEPINKFGFRDSGSDVCH
jgi:hypothetical protein